MTPDPHAENSFDINEKLLAQLFETLMSNDSGFNEY